jgi:histone acetyltransferase 1
VHSYERDSGKYDVHCAIGTDTGACEYHDRAQRLALWYIETANGIDITDDRWEIYYIVKVVPPQQDSNSDSNAAPQQQQQQQQLVGYFTVFNFRNSFTGVHMRICQALILPPYQRQGHGNLMMQYLYSIAHSRESCVQITVEDPAPAFITLRDVVDATLCRYVITELNCFIVKITLVGQSSCSAISSISALQCGVCISLIQRSSYIHHGILCTAYASM